MTGPIQSTFTHTHTLGDAQQSTHRKVLLLMAGLFFMFGFITVLNDILVPHLQAVFELNYARALLVQLVWFIGFFAAGWPSSKVVERLGYKRSIVAGLLVMATGALSFIPAVQLLSYNVFLLALFVLACGVTLLQVSVNPYVAGCGPTESASARLNLVQAFNSVGTMVGPIFGSLLIFGGSSLNHGGEAASALTDAQRLAEAQSVELPYLLISFVLIVMSIVVARYRVPTIHHASAHADGGNKAQQSLWSHRNLVFGVPAIFVYVLAEIGVGSLFIAFISRPEIGDMSHREAGPYLSLLWGGMMVGRFIGSALMSRISSERVLAGSCVGAMAMTLTAVFSTGTLALWALVLVGLFHSIIFPTIFSLSIRGLGPLTEKAAGILFMASLGGAFATLQGLLADKYGLQMSFLLPAVCQLYILCYAIWSHKSNRTPPLQSTSLSFR